MRDIVELRIRKRQWATNRYDTYGSDCITCCGWFLDWHLEIRGLYNLISYLSDVANS
jgi:hypothetical protein